MKEVFVIETDDWVYVYVDSKIAQSAHRIDLDRLMEQLGVRYGTYYLEGEWDSPLQLAMNENTPETIDSLPKELRYQYSVAMNDGEAPGYGITWVR